MADMHAIQDLLYRVCYSNDERDAEMWRSCWTEDAEMGGGAASEIEAGSAGLFKGRDQVTQALTRAWKTQKFRRRHVLSNVFLLEDGKDEAVVSSYITLFLIENEGRPKLEITGRYRDHVVRQDGCWRIRKRHAVMDSVYEPGG